MKKELLRPMTYGKLQSYVNTESVVPQDFAGCLGKGCLMSVHCFLAQLWNTANGIGTHDQIISRVHGQGFSAEECPNQGSASEPLCLAWFLRRDVRNPAVYFMMALWLHIHCLLQPARPLALVSFALAPFQDACSSSSAVRPPWWGLSELEWVQ